ncbi:DMT family transporter [Marinivivus vitaminiproducens]|uniref:DMT family transporter n=1 Tax=Marinivivus vitaminiproducens TaxID=3035935 RepID=UPI0027A7FAE8|nr:DMT family transporter [Geminicoccaceae bacterium SCSIO 64248]
MSDTASQPVHPPSPGSILKGVGAALVTVAIWTSWIVGTRTAVAGTEHLSPFAISFLRFAVAGIVLAPLWWRMRFIPRGLSWPVLLGLMCSGAPYVAFLATGLTLAPAAEAGPLLPGTLPLLVAVLSALFLGERFGPVRLAGFALIALGIASVAGNGLLAGPENAWQGHLMILGSALSWAIYTIAFRKSGLTGAQAAAFVAFWSLILLLPFAGGTIVPALMAVSLGTLLTQIVIQGILAGVVALVSYGMAVRHLGPSRAAAVTAITPASALLVAIPVLGEWPDGFAWFGCAATVIGVVFASGAVTAAHLVPAGRDRLQAERP